MIKKLIRQMLTAQIFSALTVSLCLMIDSIMIGRFLGVGAIAAYQYANPLLLILGAFSTMLSAGVQVACSRSLGRGSKEETDKGYSSALFVGLATAVVFLLIVILFRSPLATALGAGTKESNPEVYEATRAYMLGFVIGAPAMMLALVLVPFLQMGGKSTLLIFSVLTMTVADVVLDLLNVYVFEGGMFGMGLASSISYYAALLVALIYFLSKKCAFSFSFKLISRAKMREVFQGGLPAVFAMASTVVMIFVMNHLLNSTGGTNSVAAFSVIQNIGNSANCITTGVGGVSLTLAGILYNEEDRNGLREMLRLLCLDSLILGLLMGALIAVFSPYLAALFLKEAGEARTLATLGIRLYAFCLVPCCMNGALKNYYQATEKPTLTVIISILESAVLSSLFALLLSIPFGTTGAWLYAALGETATLILIGVYITARTRKLPWKDGAALLLGDDFSVPAEDLLEMTVKTTAEAMDASKAASEFCESKGGNEESKLRISLIVEELAENVVQHGFTKDSKPHQLDIRMLSKKDLWVLRFRDDCKPFDPVSYVPREGKSAAGIRLAIAMADDSRYTNSLSMNNLTMILNKEVIGSEEGEI